MLSCVVYLLGTVFHIKNKIFQGGSLVLRTLANFNTENPGPCLLGEWGKTGWGGVNGLCHQRSRYQHPLPALPLVLEFKNSPQLAVPASILLD